ncbi:MAG: hypothetical protein DIU67_010855 [Actinomycetes bacterium]|nr:MAG: hypothetical protein DIU67_10820 [Actinomycetota bacterium]
MSWCSHRFVLTTETAGIERTVCERCGHVWIRYVGNTVRVFPDRPVRLPDASELPSECRICGAKATHLIPGGVACAEHAWEEAIRQEERGLDLWVPIEIDQNATTNG